MAVRQRFGGRLHIGRDVLVEVSEGQQSFRREVIFNRQVVGRRPVGFQLDIAQRGRICRRPGRAQREDRNQAGDRRPRHDLGGAHAHDQILHRLDRHVQRRQGVVIFVLAPDRRRNTTDVRITQGVDLGLDLTHTDVASEGHTHDFRVPIGLHIGAGVGLGHVTPVAIGGRIAVQADQSEITACYARVAVAVVVPNCLQGSQIRPNPAGRSA